MILEVKKLIAALSTDAPLAALLGVTSTDRRIYSYYQPAAVIDDAKKAYITYANTAFPEQSAAVGEPVFTLAIWGLNLDAVEAVRDRLVTLLHETPLTTYTGRALHATVVNERDSYQENTKFTGKTLTFKFGFSKV